MPIDKNEFQTGTPQDKIEEAIAKFLNERRDHAFTSKEIMDGVHFTTNFNTPETTRISTFAVADFAPILTEMVRKGRVRGKVVEGQWYFATPFAGNGHTARCPKCATLVEAKKTWKMAGRPNKQGLRVQLHIGLFECPTHGTFRTTLGKQRI